MGGTVHAWLAQLNYSMIFILAAILFTMVFVEDILAFSSSFWAISLACNNF